MRHILKAQQREITRRREGQKSGNIREEVQIQQRKRDADLRKKEKQDAQKHRQELKKKLLQDKAERAAEKARREGKDAKAAYDAVMSGAASSNKSGAVDADQKAIDILLTYRSGGRNQTALKTLRVLISNLINKPHEPKYRKINLNNKSIKQRLTSLQGGVAFLLAVGFKQVINEEVGEKTLLIDEADINQEKLKASRDKIDAALRKI